MDHEIVIKLENINAVPELYINGERITLIESLSFDWQTKQDSGFGYSAYAVSHFKEEESGGVSRNTIKKERGMKQED